MCPRPLYWSLEALTIATIAERIASGSSGQTATISARSVRRSAYLKGCDNGHFALVEGTNWSQLWCGDGEKTQGTSNTKRIYGEAG